MCRVCPAIINSSGASIVAKKIPALDTHLVHHVKSEISVMTRLKLSRETYPFSHLLFLDPSTNTITTRTVLLSSSILIMLSLNSSQKSR